jgi:hypothetical protein
MKEQIVDTNVPVVANDKDAARSECVLNCARALEELMLSGCLVIDADWKILTEYMRNLKTNGAEPKIGDRFLKWVLTNKSNPSRCTQIKLSTTLAAGVTHYDSFPKHAELKMFDINDRKFLAIANTHPEHPPIMQAADCKWWGYRNAFKECGIRVIFLCEKEIEAKFKSKIKNE